MEVKFRVLCAAMYDPAAINNPCLSTTGRHLSLDVTYGRYLGPASGAWQKYAGLKGCRIESFQDHSSCSALLPDERWKATLREREGQENTTGAAKLQEAAKLRENYPSGDTLRETFFARPRWRGHYTQREWSTSD